MANNEYEAHHWTDKELITAPKLNRIEEQLEYLTDNVFSMDDGNTLKKPFYYKFQYEGTESVWHETPLLYVYGNTDRWLTSIISHNDDNRIWFREYSNSEKFENYSLPAPEQSLANSQFYNILTDKKTGTLVQNNWADSWDTAVSVPNNTITSVGPWTVPETGKYILLGTACFAANATGLRQIGISTVPTSANLDRYAIVRVPAVSGDITTLQVEYIGTLTGNNTIYVCLRQTSGAALNAAFIGLKAIRIV